MQLSEGRIFIGRFEFEADLLNSLTEFCKENNIRLGTFAVIGALTSAKLGYYNQDDKKYVECISLEKKLEITSCIGNISLLNSEIFVHAHITLADHQGQCYGGHLMPGSKIFAAEYHVKENLGGELVRKPDGQTGLKLW